MIDAENCEKGKATYLLTSAALCKAMFDIYLGDTPVSPNGKKAMAEGLLKLCK